MKVKREKRKVKNPIAFFKQTYDLLQKTYDLLQKEKAM